MNDYCTVCINRPICKKERKSCNNNENFVVNWDYVGFLNQGYYPWVDKEAIHCFLSTKRSMD